MLPFTLKRILKTGDLAALSGYHPKSISRLARQGKIDGNRANPGGKQIWFVNDHRIQRYLQGLSREKRTKAKIKQIKEAFASGRAAALSAHQHTLEYANQMRRLGILLQIAREKLPRSHWKSYLSKQIKCSEVEARAAIAFAKRHPEQITYEIAFALFKRLSKQQT